MSWQAYVDDHLMCDIEGHQLSAAAILGHDGSVWAQSTSFPQVLSLSLSTLFLTFYSQSIVLLVPSIDLFVETLLRLHSSDLYSRLLIIL